MHGFDFILLFVSKLQGS